MTGAGCSNERACSRTGAWCPSAAPRISPRSSPRRRAAACGIASRRYGRRSDARTLEPVATRAKARFIPPILLLKTEALPDDSARWLYELKLDGYRAIAFKTGGRLHLRSRNDNDFSVRY